VPWSVRTTAPAAIFGTAHALAAANCNWYSNLRWICAANCNLRRSSFSGGGRLRRGSRLESSVGRGRSLELEFEVCGLLLDCRGRASLCRGMQPRDVCLRRVQRVAKISGASASIRTVDRESVR
jgi:hypothetical protein